ncbi:MAG: 3-dehydroquinate synthase [Clostridia bacterium]|nr:3-dehydroquinate synthase [Clostridia bacterium]
MEASLPSLVKKQGSDLEVALNTVLHMNLGEDSYDIIVERGALGKASEYLKLDRKVLILTDSGVPEEYSRTVADMCKTPYIYTIEQGEASKSFESFKAILEVMCEKEFTRTDCVVAVGGGVCGDLAGFCAACYMRGIDFYNIPTTVLSQVDSSIGGKTAVDFGGYKNIVGAFHQPKKVIIDNNVLLTLPERRIADGLSESLKMAATYDKELFELFENNTKEEIFGEKIDEIIIGSLKIKKDVVEKDEKETGLRRILNFGHTVAHALESCEDFDGYFHGECVAIGMLPMCEGEVRERIRTQLCKMGLPTKPFGDAEKVLSAIAHDKKLSGSTLSAVYVPKIGEYEIRKVQLCEYRKELSEYFENC